MSRKAITKSLRFKILQRDNFTCQYCGSTPGKGNLEIDHKVPVSKGGGNEESNLVVSCFDCNRGKNTKSLKQRISISAADEQGLEVQFIRRKIELKYGLSEDFKLFKHIAADSVFIFEDSIELQKLIENCSTTSSFLYSISKKYRELYLDMYFNKNGEELD